MAQTPGQSPKGKLRIGEVLVQEGLLSEAQVLLYDGSPGYPDMGVLWDFAQRTGIQWAYIPYKGGSQAVTDVVAGQSNVLFNGMLATYPSVKGGRLRGIAVSSAHRV